MHCLSPAHVHPSDRAAPAVISGAVIARPHEGYLQRYTRLTTPPSPMARWWRGHAQALTAATVRPLMERSG